MKTFVVTLVVIILIIGALLVAQSASAEEPGNGIFPLQCLTFHPGRAYTWMDSCQLLPLVIKDQTLVPTATPYSNEPPMP